jgi:hypothetical protein
VCFTRVPEHNKEDELSDDDMQEEKDEEDPDKFVEPEVKKTFDQLRASQAFAEKYDSGEKLEPEVEDPKVEDVDACLANGLANAEAEEKPARIKKLMESCKEEIKQIINAEVKDNPTPFLPPADGRCTLAGALRGHSSFEDAKTDLFRLLCMLRIGVTPGSGCDSHVMKSHLGVRTATIEKKQRWQDQLRRNIALSELEDKMPARRMTRQAGFIQVAQVGIHRNP